MNRKGITLILVVIWATCCVLGIADGRPDLAVKSGGVTEMSVGPNNIFGLSGAAFTVANEGTAESPATIIRYYRSTDPIISKSDTQTGTSDLSALGAGDFINLPFTDGTPNSPGIYYYGVCVDSVANESNTDNNCATIVKVIVGETVVRKPDLVIDEPPRVSKSTLAPGESFDLTVTVANKGTAESPATTLRYYRSSDNEITTSDTPVGTPDNVGGLGLPTGGRSTSQQSVTLTAPNAPGTYYYGACVDSVANESNITNNCSAAIGITVQKTPTIDDTAQNKIYWTDYGTKKIQRSNLDGSGVQDLVTGLEYPSGIALDVSGGRMYWTDVGPDKIQRSNLDGSGVQDLVTIGLERPSSIALDVAGGKMYWADPWTDKIQRSNLDGSGVEDLITTGLSAPVGIALDVAGGKMYWTDVGTERIQRSNLDGSGVEDLVTGLGRPSGIALSISPITPSSHRKPDLAVESVSVSKSTLSPGESFTLFATVKNYGTAESPGATLRYYHSSDRDISHSDTQVDTDTVGGLGLPTGGRSTSEQSATLAAPNTPGRYYYGACVDSIANESKTNNNCSDAVEIVVEASDIHGNTRADATHVSIGIVRIDVIDTDKLFRGVIAPSNDIDYFRVEVTGAGRLTVYTTGNLDTVGQLQDSSGNVLANDDNAGTGNNFRMQRVVNSSTYYVKVQGRGGKTGAYTFHAHIDLDDPDSLADLVVELPWVSPNTVAPGESFELGVTVRNKGDALSPATTLRYYLSPDKDISAAEDTEVDTDAVSRLAANGRPDYSTQLTAPNAPGTYYYGACVVSVANESNITNNCSTAISITVKKTPTIDDTAQNKIYWTWVGKIWRSNLDGSGIQDLVTTGGRWTYGIALDVSGGKMYWTDQGTDKIQRSNLDGSGVQDLVTTGLSLPNGIALDVSDGKMYWTDPGADKIQRSNLDGSGVEDLVTTGLENPRGIALDVAGDKMYWTDVWTDKIQRSNLDGSGIQDLVTTGLDTPLGIALDVVGRKMYWTDSVTDKIQRSNLDGSGVEDLITTGLRGPSGIALDVAGGKMYWTELDKIQRSNLDGSNVEHLVTGSGRPSSIAIALDVAGGSQEPVEPNDQPVVEPDDYVCLPPSSLASGQIGTPLLTLSASQPSLGEVVDVAFSPDGGKIYSVTNSLDGTSRWGSMSILIQNALTGEVQSTFELTENVESRNYEEGLILDQWHFAFNDVGDVIAAGIFGEKVKLWREDNSLHTLQGNSNPVGGLTITADGRLVAGWSHPYPDGDGNTPTWDIYVWNTIDHSLKTVKTTEYTDILLFSPDGRTLASPYGRYKIRLWDWEKDENLKILNNIGRPESMAFSPDGRILAIGHDDGEIRLWNWEKGEILDTFEAHSDDVLSLVFNCDGSVLASGSVDGTIHLWDVTKSKSLQRLLGHLDAVRSLAFNPVNGEILVSGSNVGALQLWDVSEKASPIQVGQQNLVRLIYFLPSDYKDNGKGEKLKNMQLRLDTMMRSVQLFFAQQMENHGLPRKSFRFETDEYGKAKVQVIHGDKELQYYTEVEDELFPRVAKDVKKKIGTDLSESSDLYVIVLENNDDVLYERLLGLSYTKPRLNLFPNLIEEELLIGSSTVLLPSQANNGTVAHELGHAFGLDHDFRHDNYIMSYGKSRDRLSEASSKWLDNSRFFNAGPFDKGTKTTISELCDSKPRVLKFRVKDPDGIHQVRFEARTKRVPPGYHGGEARKQQDWEALDATNKLFLHDWRQFEGSSSATVEFNVDEVIRNMGWMLSPEDIWVHHTSEPKIPNTDMAWDQIVEKDVEILVIDLEGNIASQKFNFTNLFCNILETRETLKLKSDVNGDGVVSIDDLKLVKSKLGQKGELAEDVNGDGVVSILDILIVSAAIAEEATAPTLAVQAKQIDLSRDSVQKWLTQAEQLNITDPILLKGVRFLEQLLAGLTPKETLLFPNYPNPFNPETWVPYQLAKPVDVALTVYNINGSVVRRLDLGHQRAGIYRSRTRAAYWDGRNTQGEPVASGIYFYTLTAGEFTATRKLLIRK